MSREDPQLKVRLPQELKDKITESASSLGRSINADVVARLEQSFKPASRIYQDLIEDTVTISDQIINSQLNHEIQDLRELLKQSTEANKAYFQMIVDLLNKTDS
ncbi:MAG: Arc family DNA-binding protein [Acinetobacter populi]|jgi:molybdopterin converting factor small subunit|uniref:Arc family DNA-binding protein n=1 Tax=Acinetobacter populi TaxID=1582270 RepID=UPI00235450EB|nr:Arc family DNA-binding protein [Acinetobacter populi]MCH4246474.1 Arc family DNA-binding protein [Acinetobacter populi]